MEHFFLTFRHFYRCELSPQMEDELLSKVAPLDGDVHALVLLDHAPEVVDW